MSYYTRFSGSFTTTSIIPSDIKNTINSLFNNAGDNECEIIWPNGIRVPEGSAYSPWCVVNNEIKLVDDIENLNHNYYYVEWLCQIIQNYLHPNNIKISGIVSWQGDDPNDHGKIFVKDNVIQLSSYIEDQEEYVYECNFIVTEFLSEEDVQKLMDYFATVMENIKQED